MNNQFDKSLEARFNEIFKNEQLQEVFKDAQKTGSGFYRVDEDHKITRIRKRDVEIQPIVKE